MMWLWLVEALGFGFAVYLWYHDYQERRTTPYKGRHWGEPPVIRMALVRHRA